MFDQCLCLPQPKLRDSIGELTPILEHETMTFTTADRPAICDLDEELEPSSRSPSGATDRLQMEDNLHNLPVSELRERLGKAKEDKRRIRGQLLVFEEDFRSNVGRKVRRERTRAGTFSGGTWVNFRRTYSLC